MMTGTPQRARSGRFAASALVFLVLAGTAAGCGRFGETYQRGYVLPEGAMEQIPIGSTQEQVLIVLGTRTYKAMDDKKNAIDWLKRFVQAGSRGGPDLAKAASDALSQLESQ